MDSLKDFDSFIRSCDRLAGQLEQKQLSAAVRKGAKLVQRAIASAAPEDSGDLKKGLILLKEQRHPKGKAVYQVTMDRQMNAVFQKPVRNPIRSKSKIAYYPASQEYGYFTRRPGGGMVYVKGDGSQATMNKVPGKYYMRTGADVVGEAAKNAIAKHILDEIAQEWGG